MRRFRLLVIAGVVVVVTALGVILLRTYVWSKWDPAAPTATDLDLLEVLIRQEVAGNSTHPDVYFVAFGKDTDPPPEFLRRLDDLGVPVKPVSEADIGMWEIRDRATGQIGWLVHARIIRWISRDRAKVECGTSLGGSGWYSHGTASTNGDFHEHMHANYD
jgi:hypothetical protein